MTIEELENIIVTHRKVFKVNETFQEADLCEWFNIQKPKKATFQNVGQFNFKKLSAYTSLNRLLAMRGMVIKSRNYGSWYEILSPDRVDTKVENLRTESLNKSRRANLLEENKVTFKCKWSKLKEREKARLAGYRSYPLPFE